MMNKQDFVVSFERLTSGEMLMQLNIKGQHLFRTTDAAQLVGAAHAVGADGLLFKFKDESGRPVAELEAGSVLDMSAMFLFADIAVNGEALAVARITVASMKLHRSPTLLSRAVAVAAWALAERDLPAELVVNRAAEAYVIYVHHPLST